MLCRQNHVQAAPGPGHDCYLGLVRHMQQAYKRQAPPLAMGAVSFTDGRSTVVIDREKWLSASPRSDRAFVTVVICIHSLPFPAVHLHHHALMRLHI